MSQRVALALVAAMVAVALFVLLPLAMHDRLTVALGDVEHARQATLSAVEGASTATRQASAERAAASQAVAQRDSAVARADSSERRAAHHRQNTLIGITLGWSF